MINTEIITCNTNALRGLIESIKVREQNIDQLRIKMIEQYCIQGKELQKLQREKQCSKNALTELTGINKASVHNYISISNDSRISELLESGNHGYQLETFNQKQLVKLSKLDDDNFEQSIKAGRLIIDEEEVIVDECVICNSPLFQEKSVVQIDENGKELARYSSAVIAQKITGIDRMSIGKICRGDRGHILAGGYNWKFG